MVLIIVPDLIMVGKRAFLQGVLFGRVKIDIMRFISTFIFRGIDDRHLFLEKECIRKQDLPAIPKRTEQRIVDQVNDFTRAY